MSNWNKRTPGPLLGSPQQYAPGVLDPYLLWADSTGFADYPSAHAVRVVIEFWEPFDAAQLHQSHAAVATIPRAYVDEQALICSATVTQGFFRALAGVLKNKVRRVDLAEPIIPDRPAPWVALPTALSQAARTRCPGHLLLGVIDYGCPFAHHRFRTQAAQGQWSTRVLHLWDQDAASPWRDGPNPARAPHEFGYGRELSRDQLNAAIWRHAQGPLVDEDACYRDSGNTLMKRPVSHGAHVLDLLAGPLPAESRMLPQGGGPLDRELDDAAAASADIVFVQLPKRCLQDTSGGWLAAQVLDGVRYILACAKPGQPEAKNHVVVNISFGSYVGPHDGSSIIERGLEALVGEAAKKHIRLSIVLPAGNSRLKRCHAWEELAPNKARSLSWQVLPDSHAPSFLQLWLSHAKDVAVTVTAPDGASHTLEQGQEWAWSSSAAPRGLAVYSHRCGVESTGGMVLVALPRTASFDPTYSRSMPGAWSITLHNRAGAKGPVVTVAAYVSRNDVDVGMLRRGRQSFLFDPTYDPQRYLRAAKLDLQGVGVQRRGTLNGIATGARVLAVGGWRYRDDAQGQSASEGPTRTNQTKRATAGLDWSGVSEESPALRGVLASANRSGTAVRLMGTSFAAPQAARKLAGK